MTLTNHALTGVAIAIAVQKPALVLPLALASHFALDVIPHFAQRQQVNSKEFAVGDAIVATLLVVFLAVHVHSVPVWLVVFCGVLGTLPDWVWGWRYLKLGSEEAIVDEPMSPLSRWHLRIQWSETRKGIIVEVVWFALILTYVLSRSVV